MSEGRGAERDAQPHGLGDFDVLLAVAEQFGEPRGDQLRDEADDSIDQGAAVGAPAPAAMPGHPQCASANDDVGHRRAATAA